MNKRSKDKCSAPACDRPKAAKGLCTAHYQRQLRGASLDGPLAPRGTVEVHVRFPPDVITKLKDACTRHRLTLSELVRQIVTQHL